MADGDRDGERRGEARPARRPAGVFIESERGAAGQVVPVLTVLLVNRECPWRCVYCDLRRQTLTWNVAPGDIPAQIEFALGEVAIASVPPREIKLYNAGSFFDPRAIPTAEHDTIAGLVGSFERVIVECHPSLVGDSVWRFQEQLRLRARERGGTDASPVLEVAMGLESANPRILERLNRQMTREDFGSAAASLRSHGVAVRAFVLVGPPHESTDAVESGAIASARFAFECGAGVVTLIPVRRGNPDLAELERTGLFTPPTLGQFERAVEGSLAEARGRLFADLWELDPFSRCGECLPPRKRRLERMNLTQRWQPRIRCVACGEG